MSVTSASFRTTRIPSGGCAVNSAISLTTRRMICGDKFSTFEICKAHIALPSTSSRDRLYRCSGYSRHLDAREHKQGDGGVVVVVIQQSRIHICTYICIHTCISDTHGTHRDGSHNIGRRRLCVVLEHQEGHRAPTRASLATFPLSLSHSLSHPSKFLARAARMYTRRRQGKTLGRTTSPHQRRDGVSRNDQHFEPIGQSHAARGAAARLERWRTLEASPEVDFSPHLSPLRYTTPVAVPTPAPDVSRSSPALVVLVTFLLSSVSRFSSSRDTSLGGILPEREIVLLERIEPGRDDDGT